MDRDKTSWIIQCVLCGDGDPCERLDILGGLVLCDDCYAVCSKIAKIRSSSKDIVIQILDQVGKCFGKFSEDASRILENLAYILRKMKPTQRRKRRHAECQSYERVSYKTIRSGGRCYIKVSPKKPRPRESESLGPIQESGEDSENEQDAEEG